MLRRHKTSFGTMVHKKLDPERTGHLLITHGGQKLLVNFKNMLDAVKIKAGLTPQQIDSARKHGLTVFQHGRDTVTFSRGIHPVPIGAGAHGLVFRVSKADERSFMKTRAAKKVKVPSIVLKAYRRSIPRDVRPTGFSQFVANTAMYNFIKKLHPGSFVIRPLHYYFVSDRFVARRFINAPTLEEARESLLSRQFRRRPLSEALSDKAIDTVMARNGITRGMLDAVFGELKGVVSMGRKWNFNVNPEIPIKPDLTVKNIFVLGVDANGRLIISLIDQGIRHVENVGEKLRKDQVFGYG